MAQASNSVNVLIKARDEASRIFRRVGTVAAVFGRAIKRVGASLRTVFTKALRMARYAALGLAAALAACTYKALQQEAAEVELASALKMMGLYSKEAMEKLKQQAGAIQDATVYGDEYVLTLMRMAMTLGVTKEKAADAAKAAIALYEGFSGGRGKPAIFLRYYIDALRGTGSSLASYVGELRKAKTPQEGMIILQNALARGWDVAKSKSESAGGALKQMKNKIGDIAEAIASPFLPAITSAAHAVTKWAKENEEIINWWANKIFDYVIFVKDVFFDFAKYMRADWKSAMDWVFDSFIKTMKRTAISAVNIAFAIGQGIRKGIEKGFLSKIGLWDELTYEIQKLYNAARKLETPFGKQARQEGLWKNVITPEGKLRAEPTATYVMLRGLAQKKILEKQAESIFGPTLKIIGENFKKTFTDIIESAPKNLQDAWEKSRKKLEERLAKLGGPPPKGKPAGELPEEAAPKVFDLLSEALRKTMAKTTQRALAPMRAGFLTFEPGKKFDREIQYQQETALNTRKQIMFAREMSRYMKRLLMAVEKGQPLYGRGRIRQDMATVNLD